MSILKVLQFITNHPLNRDNKFKSILRFIAWQIGSRLVPGDVVFEWINGSKLIVKTGETGLTQNIYTGLHDFEDMAFLLHALRDDDLFIDVGANLGSYTILACSAIGASGYAFEPTPNVHKRLAQNVRLNNIENRVKCLNIGIGNKEGNIDFTCDLDTVNHVLAPGEQGHNKINVKVSTLDIILRDESPFLMKIDVEGYETPVLEGASEILKKPTLKAVIMELNDCSNRYGFDDLKILKLMLDHGFKTYSYNPFNRTISRLSGKNQKAGNTLFIRDESFILERLKSSPKLSIYGKEF